ncbi:MAG: nicotinamide-nucleotide amidohydrolase family protein [Gammaproteobacteria bacterium]|nr:nicotinamide-nucleotide amidohydrolase family protein [Gammaproteobacteria bacterium]MBU1645632.1 nicotinamide-nucleotide amidohydrolase family protein [Gammaproteobacteria bacterium]MBU1973566.1 nicotinamide-nucleotide amidohydrolase family protein [Gammaproteobacteria bacterium]
MDAELAELSQAVGLACRQRRLFVATAESCTGGWVAQVITHTAGSSAWFERGFVTYANAAKVEMLGVSPRTLETHGAVSPETAKEMATGTLKNSNALISLAITGIAGPTGGSPGKPVGTVCFAWCWRDAEPEAESCHFDGDREAIRRQAVIHALNGLLARARTVPSVP